MKHIVAELFKVYIANKFFSVIISGILDFNMDFFWSEVKNGFVIGVFVRKLSHFVLHTNRTERNETICVKKHLCIRKQFLPPTKEKKKNYVKIGYFGKKTFYWL